MQIMNFFQRLNVIYSSYFKNPKVKNVYPNEKQRIFCNFKTF